MMAGRLPAFTTLSPQDARSADADALAIVAGDVEPGTFVEDMVITGAHGPLGLRVYRPSDLDSDVPLIVYAHMGGGVVGNLDTAHAFCSVLARISRTTVLSVDYRLAPEHRFPAGFDDVMTAYSWASENGLRFGAAMRPPVIAGDSIGGKFAALLTQRLRGLGLPQPSLQLLLYPAVDVDSETQSMRTYGDAYPLSAATMAWFMGHYLGPDTDPADPSVSPIKAADLGGLAPAIVVTAGFDPLVDQGEAYATRLRDAGVDVIYRCYESLAHGFASYTGAVPAADCACREIAGLVRASLTRSQLSRAAA